MCRVSGSAVVDQRGLARITLQSASEFASGEEEEEEEEEEGVVY